MLTCNNIEASRCDITKFAIMKLVLIIFAMPNLFLHRSTCSGDGKFASAALNWPLSYEFTSRTDFWRTFLNLPVPSYFVLTPIQKGGGGGGDKTTTHSIL